MFRSRGLECKHPTRPPDEECFGRCGQRRGVRTTFGTSSTGDEATARAVGRQRDGRIILIGTNHDAGRATVSCTLDLAAARFSSTDGPPIRASAHATATIDLGGDEEVHDGLVLGTVAIIAVGAKDRHVLVARLTANGALDTGFPAPAPRPRSLMLGR